MDGFSDFDVFHVFYLFAWKFCNFHISAYFPAKFTFSPRRHNIGFCNAFACFWSSDLNKGAQTKSGLIFFIKLLRSLIAFCHFICSVSILHFWNRKRGKTFTKILSRKLRIFSQQPGNAKPWKWSLSEKLLFQEFTTMENSLFQKCSFSMVWRKIEKPKI